MLTRFVLTKISIFRTIRSEILIHNTNDHLIAIWHVRYHSNKDLWLSGSKVTFLISWSPSGSTSVLCSITSNTESNVIPHLALYRYHHCYYELAVKLEINVSCWLRVVTPLALVLAFMLAELKELPVHEHATKRLRLTKRQEKVEFLSDIMSPFFSDLMNNPKLSQLATFTITNRDWESTMTPGHDKLEPDIK